MIPMLNLEILSLSNGMVTLTKMCWGCGRPHIMQVPLDDLTEEKTSATMCEDCASKITEDE